jgi:uncharacterized protein (DUF1697 family)
LRTLRVLNRATCPRIVKAIPTSWVGDASVSANVAFVRRGTDAKQVARELRPDPTVEEVKAINGAIMWATKRNALSRSIVRELIAGAGYKGADRPQSENDAQAAGAPLPIGRR